MTTERFRCAAALVAAVALSGVLLLSLGCGARDAGGDRSSPAPTGDDKAAAREKKIAEARAKLSEMDRSLVEAQDFCPVMPKQRLGSMGVPFKVMIKGQPVFLCCKSCKSTAEDEPEETLAAVAALKAKKTRP